MQALFLAHLPNLLRLLDEAVGLLQRALKTAERFERERASAQNDMKLATLLHGLASVEQAKAVVVLARAELSSALHAHVRALADALLKLRWIRIEPSRATRLLDSHPFKQFRSATRYVRSSAKWPGIIAACDELISRKPELLNSPRARLEDGSVDYLRVARALRLPAPTKMITDLGGDDDDYLIDFDVPSMAGHSLVMHLTGFPMRLNSDGSVSVGESAGCGLLQNYVARALAITGALIGQVLTDFTDEPVMHDLVNWAERVNAHLESLRDSG